MRFVLSQEPVVLFNDYYKTITPERPRCYIVCATAKPTDGFVAVESVYAAHIQGFHPTYPELEVSEPAAHAISVGYYTLIGAIAETPGVYLLGLAYDDPIFSEPPHRLTNELMRRIGPALEGYHPEDYERYKEAIAITQG